MGRDFSVWILVAVSAWGVDVCMYVCMALVLFGRGGMDGWGDRGGESEGKSESESERGWEEERQTNLSCVTNLFDLSHYGISLLLRRHARGLDPLHGPDVLPEVGPQRGVDGGVVHGDDVPDQARRAQRQGHGRLGAHRVAYDGGLLDPVLLQEGPDVLRHGRVVVARDMGGVAMVPEVLFFDFFCWSSGVRCVGSHVSFVRDDGVAWSGPGLLEVTHKSID